jgi:DNA invertase Pin-like site-specific DNA recombinase
MPKTVFYARVSTRHQNPSLQTDEAKRLGVKSDHVYVEKASGSRNDRPVLAQALATCQKGDTFACWRLDRVGRSVQHLSKFIADLESRGVHFKTADGSADTSTSNGRLLLHILGAVAQFERDLIIERTRAGLASAVKRGRRLGPPVIWTADMVKRARALEKSGDMTRREVAKMLGVSERTLFRGLKAARDHDEILGSNA